MNLIRIAFSLAVIVLGASFLSEAAHAQTPVPTSYLFVEVVDSGGQAISDATVQVSDPTGKELRNAKTDQKGTIDLVFHVTTIAHHYDVQISKTGYLPYETVLFPNTPRERYISRLTEEMPNSVGPLGHPSRAPVKFVLIPSTPAESQSDTLQANKRKLLLAVKRGDAAQVGQLLREGTSANTVDAKGVPVVAWATFAGDPETLRLLLDAGARVKYESGVGRQLLLIYLGEGALRARVQSEVVDRLINAGADVNASISQLRTVLTSAISQVPYSLSLETIRSLMKAGANVNAADDHGTTPLMGAASINQLDVLELLLSSGAKASIHAKDRNGDTALIRSARYHGDASLPVVNILIANGASAADANHAGETALMFAANGTSLETMRALLKAGAAINAKDTLGQSALMFAIRSSGDHRLENVKLLLSSGARVDIKDNAGLTPLELARTLKHDDIVKLLEEAQIRR